MTRWLDSVPLLTNIIGPVLVVLVIFMFYVTNKRKINYIGKLIVKKDLVLNSSTEASYQLSEQEVQKRLNEFSKDAEGILIFAGDGSFLATNPTQLRLIQKIASKTKILLNRNHNVDKKTIMVLLQQELDIRIYPNNAQNKSIRGNIKITSIGKKVCLFDRIDDYFKVSHFTGYRTINSSFPP